MNGEDRIELRHYIETVFNERWTGHYAIHAIDKEAHRQVHIQDREALSIASMNQDARLERLNELRKLVEDIQGANMPRTEADQRISALENFRSKAVGVGSALIVLAGAVGALVARLIH